MVTSSKSLACWVTVGPRSGVWGFLWGVCGREVGVVRKAQQGGEEGVGCVGRVILFDCEGQGECHEEVQEGPSAPPWGTPLPGSRKGVRPAPVRTVYLRVQM